MAARGLAAATALLAHIDETEPVAAESGSTAVARMLVAAVSSQILEESALAVALATS